MTLGLIETNAQSIGVKAMFGNENGNICFDVSSLPHPL